MSIPRDFTIDLVANTPRELGAIGKFIGIIEAPSDRVDVYIDSHPALRRGPGGSIALTERFKRCILQTATTQTIRVLVADEPQDVSNITTSGSSSGATAVQVEPTDTLSSPAAVVVGTGAASSIAANAARRRIWLCGASANTGSLYVQAAGAGAGRGFELQPGVAIELETTAAIDVRNDTGVNQTYTILEESGP